MSEASRRRAESLVQRCDALVARVLPDRKRKISRNSKKIAFISHAYHNTTKSTLFLIDYLRELYEVTTVWDESCSGIDQAFADLSFIDHSYLAVIFFQNLPNRDLLENIRNENIIVFPMYDDGINRLYRYTSWRHLRKLKFINFSRTLHETVSKWGFDSTYLQYFPKPGEFCRGNSDEVFFWQRSTVIDVGIVLRLFSESPIRLHVHRAIDPGHLFVPPSIVDEARYHITYSDWLDSRADMLSLVSGKGFYVAPREYEGIGMSFLEAMAMGKAVIAANNPTMNEYITNGYNGYLFDLRNPTPIDLSCMEEIQKNAYRYVCNGYERWEADKHKILDCIRRA